MRHDPKRHFDRTVHILRVHGGRSTRKDAAKSARFQSENHATYLTGTELVVDGV